MMDSSTGRIVIADEAEISRHGVLKREERFVLAYQLAGLLHRLGIDADVLDPSEIRHLVEKLERERAFSGEAMPSMEAHLPHSRFGTK